jgi:hypothetical protein
VPSFFRLLITSVGDSHFGQVIALVYQLWYIVSFHAS